jgi:hypothetical protein
MKQRPHLGRGKKFIESLGQNFGPEVVERTVGSSTVLQSPSIWALWKCQPPLNRRSSATAAPQGAAVKDNGCSRGLETESRGSDRGIQKKRRTTGVCYSGRAAFRREQCDVHAVGQQWKRLFTTVAKQRNNGRNCCFLWGPFQ